MSKYKYINIANILSFSRIILGALFFLIFLFVQLNDVSGLKLFILEAISIFIFIIAIITDGLDGYFARKNNEVTEFGKHFDPLSDSIFFIIVFLSFFILGLMPWYFFIIIFLRESFMHIFLRPYFKKKGEYLPANIYGKIKTIFQSIFSLLILFILLSKEFFYLYILNSETIQKYDSTIVNYTNIISYICFAIISFLSIFSLIIYILLFLRTFSGKK